MTGSCPLYAAIDLGSNSFHMLIVRELHGSIQTISKVKRKVRLAAGLDDQGTLSHDAMVRGWQCLSMFAEQLRDIPAAQIRIVGTATLRKANNAQQFLEQAEKILQHDIAIISGEVEARLIYRGVAFTSSGSGKRLVIDIGGASTELVVGEQSEAKLLTSLDMGCVTWLNNHFPGGKLSSDAFAQAEAAAKQIIQPVVSDYRRLGWKTCVGASGTIQALQEVVQAQGLDERLTMEKLQGIKQQLLAFEHIDDINIPGLLDERKPVFAPGLAILIALFEALRIEGLTLAGGALREGLAYSLISQSETSSVRQRTADSFVQRHQIDAAHAKRVRDCALQLASQLQPRLSERARSLLKWAAMFHEVGLNIEFKKAPQHAAYILDHSDLPGFTAAQQHLLSCLMLNQRGPLQLEVLEKQRAIAQEEAICLARLLRIAIIVCMRRTGESVPKVNLSQDGDDWRLNFPPLWMEDHPLRAAELELEASEQLSNDLPLSFMEGLC